MTTIEKFVEFQIIIKKITSEEYIVVNNSERFYRKCKERSETSIFLLLRLKIFGNFVSNKFNSIRIYSYKIDLQIREILNFREKSLTKVFLFKNLFNEF